MENLLLSRLKCAEDSFVERKPEGVSSDDIKKAVVAFANSLTEGKSAVLFIGVRDDGEIQGVQNTDKLQKTIDRLCRHDCYPPLHYTTQVLETEGKKVVAVETFPSKNRPHFAGPAFIRQGSISQSASEAVFADLIASRNSKAGHILEWKGKEVTVMAKGKVLGDPKELGDSRYQVHLVCEVRECNAFYVRLYGRSTYFAEPLDNVTLSRDERNGGRLMLIVQQKYQ